MGIIQTDQWLNEEFDHPTKICEKLVPYFKGLNSTQIYNQLLKFGMYRPSFTAKRNLTLMTKQKAWSQVEKIYQYYKEKWSGPDIPVFLFPLGQSRGLFMRENNTKSGVSYPDKMFLFVSDLNDPKELEALFVHEYHHVCRLRKLKKNMEDYTLLDSLIIEGLAEYAVLKNCGRSYLANWCNMYSEKELSLFWNAFLVEHLDKRKKERIHDNLLYGGGRYPTLLGYAVGFVIVENYYKNKSYNTKQSFLLPASAFIEDNRGFSKKSHG